MTMLSELLDPEVVERMRRESLPAIVWYCKTAGGRYKRKLFASLSEAQRFADACLDRGWAAKIES